MLFRADRDFLDLPEAMRDTAITSTSATNCQDVKRFNGDGLSLRMDSNNRILEVTGDGCRITLATNSGSLRVVGDGCRVKIGYNIGDILYTGDGGRVLLGPESSKERVKYIGDGGKVTLESSVKTKKESLRNPEKSGKWTETMSFQVDKVNASNISKVESSISKINSNVFKLRNGKDSSNAFKVNDNDFRDNKSISKSENTKCHKSLRENLDDLSETSPEIENLRNREKELRYRKERRNLECQKDSRKSDTEVIVTTKIVTKTTGMNGKSVETWLVNPGSVIRSKNRSKKPSK